MTDQELKDSNIKIADMNFEIFLTNFGVIKGGKNDESLAIIEVKYKVHPKDVDKLDQKIINIKELKVA